MTHLLPPTKITTHNSKWHYLGSSAALHCCNNAVALNYTTCAFVGLPAVYREVFNRLTAWETSPAAKDKIETLATQLNHLATNGCRCETLYFLVLLTLCIPSLWIWIWIFRSQFAPLSICTFVLGLSIFSGV